MKITGAVEQIFASAVALDQNGGMRNTVYALDNKVYILNYDHSMLLRFRLRKTEAPFSHPVSFRANDYDSNEFYEEEGKIVFLSDKGGYQKKKSCGTPDFEPEQIDKIFKKYQHSEGMEVTISKDILSLLDTELSHIEFVGKKGEPLKLIQRNIYSGTVLEIQEKSSGFFTNALPADVEPIAITTNNFSALFLFQDNLKFTFLPKGDEGCIIVNSVDAHKRDMTAVIAPCLYDEIIELKQIGGGKEETTDGGKKPKIRRSKPKAD